MKLSIVVCAHLIARSLACTGHLWRRTDDPEVPRGNASFGYSGMTGPHHWAELDPAKNQACANDITQSPIVIDETVPVLGEDEVSVQIPWTNSTRFENIGTALGVLANGTMRSQNMSYQLTQFHFHTPSEHRIMEEWFPMEAHFVFEAPSGNFTVLGFLIELSSEGYTTPLFKSVFSNVNLIPNVGDVTSTPRLDFTELLKHVRAHGLWSYTGSLTTPPCSEQVDWLISRQPLALDTETFNRVKDILKFNARTALNRLNQEPSGEPVAEKKKRSFLA